MLLMPSSVKKAGQMSTLNSTCLLLTYSLIYLRLCCSWSACIDALMNVNIMVEFIFRLEKRLELF